MGDSRIGALLIGMQAAGRKAAGLAGGVAASRSGAGGRQRRLSRAARLTGAPGSVVSVQLDPRLAGLTKRAAQGVGAGGALQHQAAQGSSTCCASGGCATCR